jgi:hypothetical protein
LASSSGRSCTWPAASLRLAAGSSSPLILAIGKTHVLAIAIDRSGGAAPPPTTVYRFRDRNSTLLYTFSDRVWTIYMKLDRIVLYRHGNKVQLFTRYGPNKTYTASASTD